MNQNDILQKGDKRPLKENSQPVALGDELQMTDDRWLFQGGAFNRKKGMWSDGLSEITMILTITKVLVIYKGDGNHDPETIKDVQRCAR